MAREEFIEMRVGGLTLDPVTKTPIVILKDPDNKLNLPIWIGLMEATAMATELEGIKMARPMTHDLLRSIVDTLGGVVEAIEVSDLRDSTYYASICLSVNGRKSLKPLVRCSKRWKIRKNKICQMFHGTSGRRFWKRCPLMISSIKCRDRCSG
jgi:bifunctional DNase/RNase